MPERPGRSRRRSPRRSSPTAGPGTPSAPATASRCGTARTPGGSWCPPTTRGPRQPERRTRSLPRYHGAHALLSDDGGRHWRLGFVDRNEDDTANANESAVAELPDGTLHLNARNHRGTGAARLVAWSADSGESLVDAYRDLPDVSAPGIQGNVLALPDGRLLLSTPTDPYERCRLAVLVSDDGGQHWRPAYERPEAYAGYSDLMPINDQQVGLLYEAGTSADLREVWFAAIDLADL